jgi:hypothetical protein
VLRRASWPGVGKRPDEASKRGSRGKEKHRQDAPRGKPAAQRVGHDAPAVARNLRDRTLLNEKDRRKSVPPKENAPTEVGARFYTEVSVQQVRKFVKEKFGKL